MLFIFSTENNSIIRGANENTKTKNNRFNFHKMITKKSAENGRKVYKS